MDIIYKNIFTITKDMSKTNVIVNIEVEKEYKKLIFDCEYSPKFTEDREICQNAVKEVLPLYLTEEEIAQRKYEDLVKIANLITLSIDDSDGNYLGCAHNQKPVQSHVISKNNSSLGFVNVKIKPGTYRAVINVHLVLHDDVHYSLVVKGVM